MTGPAMTNGDAIRTQGLTKRYGDLWAVNEVDLEVRTGEVYGFLGANGSGKTTTLRMLLGLVLPTAGEAEVLGMPMPAARPMVLPRVGTLVESPGAYPHLSGAVNLAILDAAGSDRSPRQVRRARIGTALEQVGLSAVDRRPVRAYSQGMRQRLGLAAALLRRPPLLILDEPSNGLDPQGIQEIRRLLLQLNYEGTTIFLSEPSACRDRADVHPCWRLAQREIDAPGAIGHLAATDWSGRGPYSRYPTMRGSAGKFSGGGRR
jgi:ABC-type multidrug transport system ATPase subunit